jgi:hypothetical protein
MRKVALLANTNSIKCNKNQKKKKLELLAIHERARR